MLPPRAMPIPFSVSLLFIVGSLTASTASVNNSHFHACFQSNAEHVAGVVKAGVSQRYEPRLLPVGLVSGEPFWSSTHQTRPVLLPECGPFECSRCCPSNQRSSGCRLFSQKRSSQNRLKLHGIVRNLLRVIVSIDDLAGIEIVRRLRLIFWYELSQGLAGVESRPHAE